MRMILILCIGARLSAPAAIPAEPAVERGMPRAEVLEILGAPQGHLITESMEILEFDRGRIRLDENGLVVTADLMSEEAYARLVHEEEIMREREAERARVERAERIERGTRELAELTEDTRFLAASAAERVRILRRFMNLYPEVDVSALYEPALSEAARELEEERREQRLAELERRVLDAERRAAEAEQRAAEAERATTVRSTRWYYAPAVVVPVSGVSCKPAVRHKAVRHRSSSGISVSAHLSTGNVATRASFGRTSTFGIAPRCAAPTSYRPPSRLAGMGFGGAYGLGHR